jgi:alginate production protein
VSGILAAVAPGASADENERPTVEFRRLLAFDLEFERGFRDRDGRSAREFGAEPLLRLIATIARGRRWSGFSEADFLSQITLEKNRPREIRNIARINQAYLRYDDDVDLRIGRWLYRDEREWLLDTNIDGVLLNFDTGAVNIDAFAGRVGVFPRQLFSPDSLGDRVNYYGILAEVEPTSDVHHAAFAILGDDRERSGDRQLLSDEDADGP